MKTDIHPTNYRPVVFQDLNDGSTFLVRSTASSDETIKWEDGNEYPLVKVHISSASHPFYTGQEKLVDVEGRVDRFKARQQAAAKKKDALAAKAKKSQKKATTSDEPAVQKVGGGSKQAAPKKAKKPEQSAPKSDKPAATNEAKAEKPAADTETDK